MSWCSVYFLFSFLTILRLVSLTSQSAIPDYCLVKVPDSDWEYDICPIVRGPKRTVEYEYSTLAVSIQTIYEFNLGGTRETGEALGSDQCPKGTWICMAIYERYRYEGTEPPSSDMASMKVWGFSTPDGGLGAVDNFEGESLTLRFRSNLNVHQPQQVLIHFICNTDVQESSSPSLAGHLDGVHTFIWTTRHTCGRNTTNVTLDSYSTDFTLLESKETSPENEEGQDLREAMPISNSSRHITTVILLSGLIVILLGVFLYFSPVTIRYFVDSCVKLVRFRAGEGRLVRWAEDELIFRVGGEEDVMVNSFEDLEDEHIPLTPSPRKNFPANYGSAW